jgi:nitrite reductase (NADH) small subunit
MTTVDERTWTPVCRFDALTPERGVAALIGTTQVAIFRTFDNSLYVLSNIDPFTGAAVLARGIVGDRAGEPTVASPLQKQVFSLVTGRCLDNDTVAVPTFATRLVDGVIEIAGSAQ